MQVMANNGLQDLMLKRRAELGAPGAPLSVHEVTRRADGLASYETMRKISDGRHGGGISDRTAQALERALQVPIERVYDAAGQPRPLGRWQPPAKFDRLDLEQRQLVENFARALLEAYDKGRSSVA